MSRKLNFLGFNAVYKLVWHLFCSYENSLVIARQHCAITLTGTCTVSGKASAWLQLYIILYVCNIYYIYIYIYIGEYLATAAVIQ